MSKCKHPCARKCRVCVIESSYDELALMVDVFRVCIVTRTFPTVGSPCHKLCERLVQNSRTNRKQGKRGNS